MTDYDGFCKISVDERLQPNYSESFQSVLSSSPGGRYAISTPKYGSMNFSEGYGTQTESSTRNSFTSPHKSKKNKSDSEERTSLSKSLSLKPTMFNNKGKKKQKDVDLKMIQNDNFHLELKCAEMRKRNISLAAENRQANERMASLDAQLEIYMQSEAEVTQLLRQEQNKIIDMQEHLKSMEEEKNAIRASIRDSQCLSIFQLDSKLEKLQNEVAKTQVYHSYPDIDLDEKFNDFCDRINQIKTHVKYHNDKLLFMKKTIPEAILDKIMDHYKYYDLKPTQITDEMKIDNLMKVLALVQTSDNKLVPDRESESGQQLRIDVDTTLPVCRKLEDEELTMVSTLKRRQSDQEIASMLNSTSGMYDEDLSATKTISSMSSSDEEIEFGCVRPRKAPSKPKRATKTPRNLNFEPNPMDFPLNESYFKERGFLRKSGRFFRKMLRGSKS